MHGGIGFDFEQLRHVHRANFANPAKIISHQVDNHQVLGALFLIGAQVKSNGAVFGIARTSWSGALDRFGRNRAVNVSEQELLW